MDLVEFASKLSLLRARIEAGITRPAILIVTSARKNDGKSLVSYGLASSLVEANYKTLLVNANQDGVHGAVNSAPRLSDHPDFDVCAYVAPGQGATPDSIDLGGSGVAASGSIDAVRATFDRFRERYEYTVVDTSVLSSSSLSLLFAAVADGVIVSIRDGRSITSADKDTSNLLRTAGANFLGAVTADSRAIRDFRTAAKEHGLGAFSQVRVPYDDGRVRGSRAHVPS